MIDTLLFDMDGVLVDSFDAWVALLDATADQFGHPHIDPRTFKEVFGQPTKDDVALFFPGNTVPAIDDYYTANFSRFTSLIKAIPGAVRLTNRLKVEGYQLGVVTNTPGPIARPTLEKLGFQFQVVIGGDEVPFAKPAPDMVLEACNQLNRSISKTMVIGDSAYDEEAAKLAGAAFLRVGPSNRPSTIKDIRGLPSVLKTLGGPH